MKTVTINTEIREIQDDCVLAEVLVGFENLKPFAVAVNGRFVSKERLASTNVNQGDIIDLVTPMQGG